MKNKKAMLKPNYKLLERKPLSLIVIRWELIGEDIMEGLNGKQIAAKYRISYDTLSRRCKIEKGCGFADYIRNFPISVIREWDAPNKSGKNTWERIYQMLEAGAPGTEVAAALDISAEFLYKIFR